MNELTLKINPYHRELKVNLPESRKEKILNKIMTLANCGFANYTIPSDGFQGFELDLENGDRIQVFDETVIYRSDGILQMLHDRDMTITYMLMKEFMKDYGRDLYYIRETVNASAKNIKYRKIK
jgi:hypothetical protein